MTIEQIEKSLGLQPGESYGGLESYHTCRTKHRFKGVSFDVWYDEDSSSPWAWKCFIVGIGTKTATDRDEAIRIAREAIEFP